MLQEENDPLLPEMKVLLIANKPPYPPRDGGALATLNMATGLADSGIKVSLIVFASPKHYVHYDVIPNELKKKIDFHIFHINTKINPVKALLNLIFSKQPYNVERFYRKNISNELCLVVSRGHFDLIQLEGLYLAPYIPDIRKIFSKTIIYRAHNIEHIIWEKSIYSKRNPLIQWYYNILSERLKRLEATIHNQVDAIIPITQTDSDWFIKKGVKKPMVTIPVGFNATNEFLETDMRQKDSICFIGSLEWIPNQEGLMWFVEMVLPELIKLRPNIKIHVAGRNTPKKVVDRLLVEKQVIFHGEVEDSTFFIRNFNVAVVPLFSGSGIRVKIVEFMLNKVAVIATPKAVEGINITNGTHLVISDDPKEFALKINDLMINQALLSGMISNAYDFANKNFNILRLTYELINFYKQLADAH